MKTKEGEVMNSGSRDRTGYWIESGEWSGGEGEGAGRAHQSINSQVLRAVSLRTFLLDVRLNISIRRDRGCASHLR